MNERYFTGDQLRFKKTSLVIRSFITRLFVIQKFKLLPKSTLLRSTRLPESDRPF